MDLHIICKINSISNLNFNNRQAKIGYQMGGQCSSSRHSKDDYELICEQEHPTFGQITLLRALTKLSNSFPHGQQLAAKLFTFEDQ